MTYIEKLANPKKELGKPRINKKGKKRKKIKPPKKKKKPVVKERRPKKKIKFDSFGDLGTSPF